VPFLAMPDISVQVDIPNRSLFKASEVCDLVKLQPYVLRSWEAEFPDLGVAKADGSTRVYRRADVEQVVRIKHLLLVEGLTLAGARRKLDEEGAPVAIDQPAIVELVGKNARERLTAVKLGLRSILDMIGPNGDTREFRLSPPIEPRSRSKPVARAKASRRKPAAMPRRPTAQRSRPRRRR
jgi:DNA-binding transcriptional MerR regulator